MLALNVLGLKQPNAPSWRMPNGTLCNPRPSSHDGYRLDGSEEDFRALAHLGIVVAFRPTLAVGGKGAAEQWTSLGTSA